MAFIKYYLDKPYNPLLSKEELKQKLKEINVQNKTIPKNILNPKDTTLYLFFSYANGSRIKIKVPFKVNPIDWDFTLGKFKPKKMGSDDLNFDLDSLSRKVYTAYTNLKEKKPFFNENELKSALLASFTIATNKANNSLDEAIEDFLKKRKGLLTEGTIKEYNTAFKRLREFQSLKKARFSFNDFNQAFFNQFEQFLVNRKNPYEKSRGLLNDTIVKCCSTLLSFLKWAFENGYLHSKENIVDIKYQIKKNKKNDIITLTENELESLMKLDLSKSKTLEKVRDMFCFGCYTGQRFSDFVYINKNDMTATEWNFTSQKTKKPVFVPFNGFIKQALPILERNNYQFNTMSNQKFNFYLKEIGERAGINSTVRTIRYSGTKKIEFEGPKYDFMSSHMARRTFVTIMLQKGVPITLIQKITQHADIKTLMKYEGHDKNALVSAIEKTN